MLNQEFSQLLKEIQKFSNFRSPELVRNKAARAISEISNHSNQVFPINNSNSELIQFFIALFDNITNHQQISPILAQLLLLIRNKLIIEDALNAILEIFASISYTLNAEHAMQILQLTAEEIPNVFPNLISLELYFSIMLALMAHENVIISTTAFTFFPQVLESIYQQSQKDVSNEFILFCSNKYNTIFTGFKKPYNFIFYILFSDMANIALKQPMNYLKIDKVPSSVIYDLLDLVVSQYSQMLISEPQLISIFDGAVINAMSDANALQFIIGFFDVFLECHESLCTSLFEDFTSRFFVNGKQNYAPLFFFRSIATKNNTLPARFFSLCDNNGSLLKSFLDSLIQISESNVPVKTIVLSLQPYQLKKLDDNNLRQKFIQCSPYEIIFGITKSFSLSTNTYILDPFSQNFSKVLKIIQDALLYSTLETFFLPCDSLLETLTIVKKYSLNEPKHHHLYDELYGIVCNFLISQDVLDENQQRFQTFDKQGLYQRFLCKIAENHPELCSGKWVIILNSIFRSNTALSLNFAENFDDSELQSIMESAIAINPLPYDFISTLINANMERFEKIWIVLEPFFKFNLKEEQFDINVLNLFLELMSKCVTSNSEEAIMSMAVQFVSPDSALFLKDKDKVLNQLKQFLSENIDVVKNSWNQIFQVISPKNFGNNPDTTQASFYVLSLIVNDLISLIPQSYIQNLIDTIFKFADSEADINLSLSSFDLLWAVVRVMDNSSNNWIFLISEILRLIKDTRNDVSQCSIRTFFSLMSSNFKQIPPNVIDTIVSHTFSQILTSIDYTDPERESDMVLALQEISHYASSFWADFDKNPNFKSKFIPLLIDTATNFCLKSQNQELVTNSFQLYECLFQCEILDSNSENILRKSLLSLTSEYVKISDRNSLIFPCFGRILNHVLLTLKTRNVLPTLKSWFPIFKTMVRNLECSTFVHIMIQRTFDTFPLLFPMPTEISLDLISLLVEFAVGNVTSVLPKYIIEILCKIFTEIFKESSEKAESGMEFLNRCKPLAMIPCSEPLMKLLIETKIKVDDSSANNMIDFYTSMAKMWPSLQSSVNCALVLLIDKSKDESQKNFVLANSDNFQLIKLLWETFFDPDSEKFNEAVYNNCFDIAFGAIQKLLSDNSVDKLPILQFLAKSNLPTSDIGNFSRCHNWHLLKLIKIVNIYILSEDKEIRVSVKEIFDRISETIEILSS